ncbi:MAG TPA: type II toxin-antitoxin system VapC family toxin [Mycobacteriales bacterium]
MDFAVLDTDVASQIFRQRLTGPLADRLARPTWAVTFVTEGELWKWAGLRNWSPLYRQRLEFWLSRVIVLPSGESVSRTWGRIVAAAQRRGRLPPVNDSWIAAHCLTHGLPLATHSTKDFLDLADHEGLTLLTG